MTLIVCKAKTAISKVISVNNFFFLYLSVTYLSIFILKFTFNITSIIVLGIIARCRCETVN